MKIFIDTANINEIKEANSWGILDGVTTNPSLVAKEGGDFITTIKEIASIVDGPISAEVISLESKQMQKEALQSQNQSFYLFSLLCYLLLQTYH